MRELPREIQGIIFSFDPTYRPAYEQVVRQVRSQGCIRCVAAGRDGRRRRAAFDGFTDIHVRRSGTTRWINLACRACGTIVTAQVETEHSLVETEGEDQTILRR